MHRARVMMQPRLTLQDEPHLPEMKSSTGNAVLHIGVRGSHESLHERIEHMFV